MSGAVPIWLLDVDGVINVRRPGWRGPPSRAKAWAYGVEWSLRWAPALVGRIRGLHGDGVVEVRWCSTWCPWAGQLEDLFRLPSLERAFGEVPDMPAAKLAAARAVLAGGRRLVWTDDDEVPEPGALYDELSAGGRALLIRPAARRGLQPRHLDAIETFARTSPGPSAA